MGSESCACKDFIRNFVKQLSENDDTPVVVQSAFAQIGEKYGIGKLYFIFDVADNVFTKGGEHREQILYDSPCALKDEPDYIARFITGENGVVIYYVHRYLGLPAFSEEERADVEMILQILFIHSGRWRMISRNRKIGLSDALTGLPNAGGFLTYIDELLDKGEITDYNAYYFKVL